MKREITIQPSRRNSEKWIFEANWQLPVSLHTGPFETLDQAFKAVETFINKRPGLGKVTIIIA